MTSMVLAPPAIILRSRPTVYHAILSDPTSTYVASSQFLSLSSLTALHNPISTLALELLVEILLLCCGSYFGSRGTFLDNRGSVVLVCRRWREAVVTCGAFWSSYIFRPLRSRSTFDIWTSRFCGHPLDVIIELDRAILWTAAKPTQLSVQDLLAALSTLLPSCRRLTIEADDVVVLTALSTMLSSLVMPRLQYLAMICEPISSLASLSAAYYPTQLPKGIMHSPTFVPSGPGPAFIRLSGLVLTWTHCTYYANVTTLILQYFSTAVAPTEIQLHAILREAVLVCRLSLNGICCTEQSADLEPIMLDRLEELQLRVARNPALGHVVSLIRAPSLRVFHVFIDGQPDLDVLVRSSALFSRVTSLVLDGDHVGGPSVAIFFAAMPRVVHCDIRMSGLFFFQVLADGGCALFPCLRSLVMSEPNFDRLERFVNGREALWVGGTVLDDLRIMYMYGCDLNPPQLDWLTARVIKLDLDPGWEKFWYHLK
ncbi:hypothetical protein DFH06DRAFT_1339219 [Mycena polygramma]|nr:hypothetical protein DFH06DRAFT_1339219 [Mycena polygramma]